MAVLPASVNVGGEAPGTTGLLVWVPAVVGSVPDVRVREHVGLVESMAVWELLVPSLTQLARPALVLLTHVVLPGHLLLTLWNTHASTLQG